MNVQLNFARKWRSRSFDQLVGQDISVRILKNSLYLNHYFPVYLFAGQRGCGKTTMARIFAAAINCEKLPQFQQDPKQFTVPCLVCASCCAMAEGKHPDFIEIDAASYTGVDNVRQIIDTAALLPLIGRKKVYLIDEAHMLSKAAFNAFLKVLEEPPASVLFILATTELQKIIDTVKSRSFQLFFKAVKSPVLINYLEHICATENIPYESDGLALIVQETQGSVRDALNLLEQVRFAVPSITKASVSSVLGHVEDEVLLDFFECILLRDEKKILACMHEHDLQKVSVESLWNGLMHAAHAATSAHFGLPSPYFIVHETRLKKITTDYSLALVNCFLKLLFTHEPLFVKTRAQYNFLEMMLLDFCADSLEYKKSGSSGESFSNPPIKKIVPPINTVKNEQPRENPVVSVSQDDTLEQKWQSFITLIEPLNDPLLSSIFKQIHSLSFNAPTSVLIISYSKDLIFFNEWLENTVASWRPLLQKIFGQAVQGKIAFDHEPKIHNTHESQAASVKPTSATPIKQKESFTSNVVRRQPSKNSSSIDISDASVWKNAPLVIEHFPGTLQEVKESHHE